MRLDKKTLVIVWKGLLCQRKVGVIQRVINVSQDNIAIKQDFKSLMDHATRASGVWYLQVLKIQVILKHMIIWDNALEAITVQAELQYQFLVLQVQIMIRYSNLI